MKRAIAWLALMLGCGTSAAPRDGAAGDTGSGGTGGSSAVSCPSAAPAPNTTCAGAQTCFYEDCAGVGRTVASCASGAWNVQTGPCTGVFCQSQTCAVGQLCLVRAGGALFIDCVDNACGGAAIACGCLQSCVGTCTVGGSLETGVTIQCNTCSSNLCP
jgi:hypothetical protein